MQIQIAGSPATSTGWLSAFYHGVRAATRNRFNPYQQFTLFSLVVLISGSSGIGWWISGQIQSSATSRASETAALYIESLVAPTLQSLSQHDQLTPNQIANLSQLIEQTPLGRELVGFIVWSKDGHVLYSSDRSQIGRAFAIEEDLEQAIQGSVTSELINARDEVHVPRQTRSERVLSTYAPVRLANTDHVIAVAEFYQEGDNLQHSIALAQQQTWAIVALAALAMYMLLVGFVRRTSVTITHQKHALNEQVAQLTELLDLNADLHERVRRATARNATTNERFLRRISAELHDGPAQYLGLALLRLDELLEHAETCANGQQLGENIETIEHSLRGALIEVRAISAGMGLPDLQALTLPETIGRVVHDHERRTRTTVALEQAELPEQASLSIKITLYRLIQEALSNAHRHAGGIGQQVRARVTAEQLMIEIHDQGPGMRALQSDDPNEHLGLAGMRERVESMGGIFQIESRQKRGTCIRALLPVQAVSYDAE